MGLLLLPDTPSPGGQRLSSVTRLSGRFLTRGFASQPHDWFAFIGEGFETICFLVETVTQAECQKYFKSGAT